VPGRLRLIYYLFFIFSHGCSELMDIYLNEPPMAYLTRWRLQLGAQMLASTS
jgi:hypothetical protein